MENRYRYALYLFPVLVLYLITRILGWLNGPFFEDHDSIAYLLDAQHYLSLDGRENRVLSPDHTPFYPFLTAVLARTGLTPETAARLVSLLSSIVLFGALVVLARQVGTALAVAAGLLIVSLNPVLIRLSYSVLTEPSYIATVYLGLAVFWASCTQPRAWIGGLLGIVFGLCFLNRTEGILYLVVIPVLQAAHFVWLGRSHYGPGRLAGWAVAFAVCFMLIAGPQIWNVSSKMGSPALNGRQAWTLMLNAWPGRSYEEKVYGLDFSESEINLKRIHVDRELRQQLAGSGGINVTYSVRKVLLNVNELYQQRLGELLGPFVIVFCAFGLVKLYRDGRRFEAFSALAFIGAALAAPLVHNVVIRHIAVIAPIMIMLAGIGIVYAAQLLRDRARGQQLVAALFVLLATGSFAWDIKGVLADPDRPNPDGYRPQDLAAVSTVIRQLAETELGRPAVLIARRKYLAYHTGSQDIELPYTDYAGLLKFCRINKIDFLYLVHQQSVLARPFMADFLQDRPPAPFRLVHRSTNADGTTAELYRFDG